MDWATVQPPTNPAWADIDELPNLREFREYTADKSDEPGYGLDFAAALDLASWVLRAELKRLRRERPDVLPPELHRVQQALTR